MQTKILDISKDNLLIVAEILDEIEANFELYGLSVSSQYLTLNLKNFLLTLEELDDLTHLKSDDKKKREQKKLDSKKHEIVDMFTLDDIDHLNKILKEQVATLQKKPSWFNIKEVNQKPTILESDTYYVYHSASIFKVVFKNEEGKEERHEIDLSYVRRNLSKQLAWQLIKLEKKRLAQKVQSNPLLEFKQTEQIQKDIHELQQQLIQLKLYSNKLPPLTAFEEFITDNEPNWLKQWLLYFIPEKYIKSAEYNARLLRQNHIDIQLIQVQLSLEQNNAKQLQKNLNSSTLIKEKLYELEHFKENCKIIENLTGYVADLSNIIEEQMNLSSRRTQLWRNKNDNNMQIQG